MALGQRGGRLADHPPEPVDIAPDPLDPGLGPFEIALRRAVRQQIETRGVGPVGIDDRIKSDDILLGLAHLFVAAGHDRPAGRIDETPVVSALHFLWEQPIAVHALIGLVADHALCKQSGEGLVEV